MRTKILKEYKKHVNDGDGLKQQLFLKKYVYDNPDIDRLLLYHGIGTGKTRTSILIAESLMKKNRKLKIIVILPARLKTNYIDELIILMAKDYKREYEKFTNPKSSDYERGKMRLFFNKIIEKKYLILSYEYVISLFKKSDNINQTLKDLTKNKILIIDEFHNLISNYIDEKNVKNMYEKNKLPTQNKFIRALIMRYISRYAHDSCKMFYLTATPVFDNYMQFVELVKLLNKKPIDEDIKSIKELIPFIKGKVSYYEIADKSDFPETKTVNEKIPLSKEQDKTIVDIQEGRNSRSDDNDETESFMMKQRQACISVYDYTRVDKILKKLDKYAPKLKRLFKLIDKYEGKHLIYSNFIQRCLYIIKDYLDKEGWVNYLDSPKEYKKYKTYVLWDGSLKDKDKQDIKMILNSVKNVNGKIIRVILGSPSIKEGISFKHIQHLHQIDPVWNISAKEQIEGRCIRYKSHDDIDEKSKLKRLVVIHNYISIPMDNDEGMIKETCDEKIYFKIIPKKEKLINNIKKILHKSAIDYFLYDSKYNDKSSKSTSSILNFDDLPDILNKKIVKKENANRNDNKTKNRCPNMRRPRNGKCPNNGILRKNAHGDDCCYKK